MHGISNKRNLYKISHYPKIKCHGADSKEKKWINYGHYGNSSAYFKFWRQRGGTCCDGPLPVTVLTATFQTPVEFKNNSESKIKMKLKLKPKEH